MRKGVRRNKPPQCKVRPPCDTPNYTYFTTHRGLECCRRVGRARRRRDDSSPDEYDDQEEDKYDAEDDSQEEEKSEIPPAQFMAYKRGDPLPSKREKGTPMIPGNPPPDGEYLILVLNIWNRFQDIHKMDGQPNKRAVKNQLREFFPKKPDPIKLSIAQSQLMFMMNHNFRKNKFNRYGKYFFDMLGTSSALVDFKYTDFATERCTGYTTNGWMIVMKAFVTHAMNFPIFFVGIVVGSDNPRDIGNKRKNFALLGYNNSSAVQTIRTQWKKAQTFQQESSRKDVFVFSLHTNENNERHFSSIYVDLIGRRIFVVDSFVHRDVEKMCLNLVIKACKLQRYQIDLLVSDPPNQAMKTCGTHDLGMTYLMADLGNIENIKKAVNHRSQGLHHLMADLESHANTAYGRCMNSIGAQETLKIQFVNPFTSDMEPHITAISNCRATKTKVVLSKKAKDFVAHYKLKIPNYDTTKTKIPQKYNRDSQGYGKFKKL